MNKQIIDFFEKRYTVVTATNRLARYIRSVHAEIQVHNGQQSWETADVLPWSAWLQRLWEQRHIYDEYAPVLLNQHQQKFIWQTIIKSSAHSQNILHVNALLNEAINSYATCKAWRIPVFPDGYYLNDDARVFQSWFQRYSKRMQEQNWLDIESMPEMLIEQGLANFNFSDTAFCGFDFITPQQQVLMQALHKHGVNVMQTSPDRVNATVIHNAFPDTDTEIITAANYARQICASVEDESIGIVVPNLEQERENIISIFQRVLNPGSLLVNGQHKSAPFNVSLGKPLLQYSAVRAALTVLALGKKKVSFDALSLLLHSVYLKAGTDEAAARARLELNMRHSGERSWFKKNLLYKIEQFSHAEGAATVFITILKDIELAMLTQPGKHRVAIWVALFSHLLDIAGWPGERDLDSDEYQLINAWNDCMEKFASLDIFLGEIDYTTALTQLSNIVNEIQFQPESPESRVQILNTTSAAAMQFDHLWLMGMHEAAWPPVVQHYPFIPAKLTDAVGFPFSNARRNYDYAKNLLADLTGSAKVVVLSFAYREKDFQHGPSPLLKKYPATKEEMTSMQEDYRQLIQESIAAEKFNDTHCTRRSATQVNAGTSIFTDQAKCPFRAFAKHRLKAEGLPEPGIGLDPMQRGSLIHLAMQYFWRETKTHAKLLTQTAEQQKKLLQQCIDKAMRVELEKQPEILNDNFLHTESERLLMLLHDWLEYEKTRPPFSVKETEIKHSLLIHNIKCYMRIDRIDALEDGSKIILDYKTGMVNVKNWFGERPEDPQLPIYAISDSEQLVAVAYARIKQGECKFTGVSQEDGILPDVSALTDAGIDARAWENQLQQWRTVIQQLAQEFHEGLALVAPVNKLACRYCDLHTLCRIYEASEHNVLLDASGSQDVNGN